MVEERRFRRAGGLAGVLGVLLFIALYPLFFYTPPFPTYGFVEVEEVLIQLSGPGLERTLFLLYQAMGFVAALLFVFLFVALHRLLRQARPGFALAGVGLGLAGSVLLSLSFLASRGVLTLADLYAAAPAAELAVIAVAAKILDELLRHGLVTTAMLMLAAALVPIGLAMRAGSPFPRIYGTLTLALGSAVIFLELAIPGAGTTITNPPHDALAPPGWDGCLQALQGSRGRCLKPMPVSAGHISVFEMLAPDELLPARQIIQGSKLARGAF